EVHWGAKSGSVSRILKAWNIAAADVVCIDDSPMDLAEIKAAHPEIECLQFPRENPQSAYELLEQLRVLFGKTSLSEEDTTRTASLRANAELREGKHDAEGAPGEFLLQIEGRLSFVSQKEPFDQRALELVNKTNQFNLNGLRFQEV